MILRVESIASDCTQGHIKVWKFVEPRCWLAVMEVAPVLHLLGPPKDYYPNRGNREAIVSPEHRCKEVLRDKNA